MTIAHSLHSFMNKFRYFIRKYAKILNDDCILNIEESIQMANEKIQEKSLFDPIRFQSEFDCLPSQIASQLNMLTDRGRERADSKG